MDRQEIYNKVRNHLLEQMERAQRPDNPGCAYRGKGGLKCAVGCLIPDDRYDSLLEGRNVHDDRVIAMIPGVTPVEANKRFLSELQNIHDDEFPENWEHALNFFAKRKGLEVEQ